MEEKRNVRAMERETQRQEKAGELVRREVYVCISGLIGELSRRNPDWMIDDFPHLFEGAASWGKWTCPYCKESKEEEPDSPPSDLHEEGCPHHKEEWDVAQDFEAIDHEEVFEHWIISEWLAGKLMAKGHTAIELDFYGVTVWGRCTTGQAIALDGDIQEIACPEEVAGAE